MPRPKTRNDDLKDRLLDESIALLHSEGRAAVTARRVATVAGTSTAAVYELFGNKSGLVRSIFFEGFEQLAGRLDDITLSDHAHDDLIALLDATRVFALDHPMLFEVMFARPFTEFQPTTDDQHAAERIYSHVVGAVAALLGTRRDAAHTVDAAHVVVTLNSGLITSELNGLLGRSEQSIRRRRALAIDATIAGLQINGDSTG